jgi:hypothetical protein
MSFRATLSETLATFSACREDASVVVLRKEGATQGEDADAGREDTYVQS